VLAEIDKLALPRLQAVLSEAVPYGEIGLSGVVPHEGVAADEITALMLELGEAGWLTADNQKGGKPDIRQVVKA
jgi:hypothetical protein